VAVRLAAVVQPRDGLLADVAALRERDRALVEPGLLRDHRVVEVDPVARAAALHPHHLRRLLVGGDRARVDERRAHCVGVVGRAEDVDAAVGDGEDDRRARQLGARVRMLLAPQALPAGDAPRLRADQREQRRLERALVQLDVAAELVPADHVEQLLQRRALCVEQQLVAEVEHAQVAEHLALVGEERRVAAAAGLQRLDVVGDLALQERLRLRAGQGQLAALGAVDQERVGGAHHSPSS
jgi:hypothetical protein